MTTRAQHGAIACLRKASGMQEGEYRALLAHHTGKGSSRELSDDEAGRFIVVLKGCAGQAPAAPPRANRATGRYAAVLQALWISGHQLGLIADRSDAAMMRFVQRQAKVSHTRFLVEPAAGTAAIEGLKKWLARGGVRWEAHPDDPRGRKLAVLEAVARALVKAGGFTAFLQRGVDPWPSEIAAYGASRGLPEEIDAYTEADIITLTIWLSENLRVARRMGERKEKLHA